MRMYEVLKIVNFDGGRITLNKEQAAARRHKLKKIKGDCYEITGRTQFKVGEKIGLDSEAIKRVHKQALRDVGGQPSEEADSGHVSDGGEDSQKAVGRAGSAGSGNSGDDGAGNDNAAAQDLNPLNAADLEGVHWTQLKKMVEDAGGEWVNKPKGIEFLKQKAANAAN